MGVRKSRKLQELGSQDLMTHLPSDLLMNILLKLPVEDIMRCKCVCKGFLDLVMTPEFVKSHLSQSMPGLLYFDHLEHAKPYTFVEFVENLDFSSDECYWGEYFNFNLPFDVPEPVHSSVNGLLFFENINESILLCNPITRECINLPYPEHTKTSSSPPFKQDTYGFGVSRISGEYKVVRMYMEIKINTASCKYDLFECQVYTVGTGSWRRTASTSLFRYRENCTGVVFNGNLHWMAFDLEREAACISCFDLETEVFTATSTPPFDLILGGDLSVLGNCLCVFNSEPDECTVEFMVHIWLMKEYGDHNSWTKEFVIRGVYYMFLMEGLRPIKVLEDGDMLIQCDPRLLLYYSNKNKTFRKINVLGLNYLEPMTSAFIYTPSFVQLKTFAMENVISF